jgi:hypothetical protein
MNFRYLMVLGVAISSALVFAATAGAASSGVFKVSASGKQELTWSLDGTRGACEIRRGAGSGNVKFSFKTPNAASLYVSKSGGITGSINLKATGTRAGSFGETTVTPCSGFEPSAPFTEDASDCGATAFAPRMDFKTKGAFTWITAPSSIATGGPSCPFYVDSSLLLSSDLKACGDSDTQYKRSWGVSAAAGEGLFASKISPSMKTLLKIKKGKSKTITGKASVDCKPASTYSSPVVIKGSLKYSLKFKRTS